MSRPNADLEAGRRGALEGSGRRLLRLVPDDTVDAPTRVVAQRILMRTADAGARTVVISAVLTLILDYILTAIML